MSETVNFTINIGGNAYTGIAEIDKAMKTLSVTANENLKLFDKFNQVAFKLNNISQFVQNASNIISSAIQPGIALNSSLADLSAIAGVTGDKLKEIEGYARDTAKTFGTDATAAAEVLTSAMNQYGVSLDDPMEASSLLIARSPNALGIGAASFAR